MSLFANPLATPTQLYNRLTSSSLPTDLDEAIFISTQCLVQAAGQLLGLPQSVTAQANVLLARFLLVERPMAHEFSDVSAAAVYLVSKTGPIPRSPRDVSNVFAFLLSDKSPLLRNLEPPLVNDPKSYYQTESEYYSFQTRMLHLEARILRAVSFNTRVALPHPLAITYLQTLDFLGQHKKTISSKTIEYLNTALLSPQLLYLTHQPHALATAAIYNAAKDVGAKTPDCEWYEVFDVDREELGFLVVAMRSLDGLVQKRKQEFPRFVEGMLTRKAVEGELRSRGLSIENGTERDAEEEVMRMMDSR